METQIARVAWQEIREHLERAKSRIDAEIRAYPAPIPACDAQFNHLMEQRAWLTRDLGRLDTALAARLSNDEAMAWLDELLCSATYLGDSARSDLSDSQT